MASALGRSRSAGGWRVVSAALTFVILCGFAVVDRPADGLARPLGLQQPGRGRGRRPLATASASTLADRHRPRPRRPRPRPLRRLDRRGHPRRCSATDGCSTRPSARRTSASALGAHRRDRRLPGRDPLAQRPGRARAAPVLASSSSSTARPLSVVEATVERMRLFLAVGVLGGTLPRPARRADRRAAARWRPIAALTAARAHIARTRDPGRRVPQSHGRRRGRRARATLRTMLDGARGVARARPRGARAPAPVRRRRLARAAHAADERAREPRAARPRCSTASSARPPHSALRSSRRMRRLVADLLLLARADADRTPAAQPTDLGAGPRRRRGRARPARRRP